MSIPGDKENSSMVVRFGHFVCPPFLFYLFRGALASDGDFVRGEVS